MSCWPKRQTPSGFGCHPEEALEQEGVSLSAFQAVLPSAAAYQALMPVCTQVSWCWAALAVPRLTFAAGLQEVALGGTPAYPPP